MHRLFQTSPLIALALLLASGHPIAARLRRATKSHLIISITLSALTTARYGPLPVEAGPRSMSVDPIDDDIPLPFDLPAVQLK